MTYITISRPTITHGKICFDHIDDLMRFPTRDINYRFNHKYKLFSRMEKLVEHFEHYKL